MWEPVWLRRPSRAPFAPVGPEAQNGGVSTGPKSVIVTVSDDALKDIHHLASRLTEHGLKVNRVLPVTGVISGSIATSKMSALRDVSGVSSVEEELEAYPSE